MSNSKTVEIYGLFDPDTDELRYIGKANNAAKRLKTHLWDSRTLKRPVCLWISDLVKMGKCPVIRVLETVAEDAWKEAEIRLIAQYRKTHKLLNLADGGDMPKPTKEQQAHAARQSIAKQKLADPAIREHNLAKRALSAHYKRLCKKPDYVAYYTRLMMKAYAALDPVLYACWADL